MSRGADGNGNITTMGMYVHSVSQVIARHLIERKAPGSIVNISSQASMVCCFYFS
jgi:short-subunit dehydrogenase